MKNLLFIPLLLISCLCFAQDAKEIIGKPIKIGNLLVAENDFPDGMNWRGAQKACAKLGKGWRIPTKDELNVMYKNKDRIGGFAGNRYWSSTESNSYLSWGQYFYGGDQVDFNKRSNVYVRAVKEEIKENNDNKEIILSNQEKESEKRNRLLAERAYRLIEAKRMKEVNRDLLFEKIKAEKEKGDFNLYQFANRF